LNIFPLISYFFVDILDDGEYNGFDNLAGRGKKRRENSH